MPLKPVTVKADQTFYVDIPEDKVLENFSIGDEVTLEVKGTIKSISGSTKYEGDKEKYPGSLSVKISKLKIANESNEFANLAKET